MNNIYLPELLSATIKDFTLYPNGLNFTYDFVKGINLIIGGNGMGKTTLASIIKYSIIGHYREGYDLTRTYKGNKIEKRTTNPWNYFSKRNDLSIGAEKKAKVITKLKIKETEFLIERGLDEISIISVFINGVKLTGTFMTQTEYDTLFYDYSRSPAGLPREELHIKIQNSLPNQFEKEIEKASNMLFDDLIFFVNKILFFGEDHRTVLWNNDYYGDVQTELFNKYFNNRDLNDQRQEALRESKYFDTQARHKSEDIRVIRNVLDKAKKSSSTATIQDINSQIRSLKDQIDSLNYKIENLQHSRNESDADLKIVSNRINTLSQETALLEKDQKKHEKELAQKNWLKLNPNYDLYVQSIRSNEICPMCTQDLTQSYINSKIAHNHKCILCDQQIEQLDVSNISTEQSLSKSKLQSAYTEINELQHTAYNLETALKDLDRAFNNLKATKRQSDSELRVLEYENLKDKQDEAKPDNLQAFYDEIDELEILKEDFQEKSKESREKALNISGKIEEEIIKNTLRFSELFGGYAEKFLGVPCTLTYEELHGQSRFYPVIDGKIREQEEELSESQRFFVDHAFRMSILSFFYNGPSFYIIETPDSSLDISYERNAADVFNKFLTSYPYCLILTTNINNSEFLNYLVKTVGNISIIDLMKIGKKSNIQGDNTALLSIYNKIIANINEKKNT